MARSQRSGAAGHLDGLLKGCIPHNLVLSGFSCKLRTERKFRVPYNKFGEGILTKRSVGKENLTRTVRTGWKLSNSGVWPSFLADRT